LSSRQKKEKPERKGAQRTVTEQLARPSGKAPDAMVTSRHGQGVVTREGRGFSLGELTGASLTPRLASGWGVRFDPRRRSTLGGNVDSLKAWAAHAATVRKESHAKELVEDVEKVERAVKKGAARAEKEAVKVETEVKEEARKAEKAVKRKVTKKAKPKKKTES